jgi:shikimate kinase
MTDCRDEMNSKDAKIKKPCRLNRTVVLVGMMGAGKSTIGRTLAQRLEAKFADADTEIERAAGCTIPEIFRSLGEAGFREGERRVISRLLDDPPHILALGGGAFADPTTRKKTKERAASIWINTDLDTLFQRVSRRKNRPMLYVSDPRAELEKLLNARISSYSEADIVISSDDSSVDTTASTAEAKLIEIGVVAPVEPK